MNTLFCNTIITTIDLLIHFGSLYLTFLFWNIYAIKQQLFYNENNFEWITEGIQLVCLWFPIKAIFLLFLLIYSIHKYNCTKSKCIVQWILTKSMWPNNQHTEQEIVLSAAWKLLYSLPCQYPTKKTSILTSVTGDFFFFFPVLNLKSMKTHSMRLSSQLA